MAYDGFELVCIEVDEESSCDDPRSIDSFGFEAPSLITKPAEVVASIQKNRKADGPYVHLKVNGQVIIPEVASAEEGYYLRTMSEWNPDDPLMELPTCNEYRYSSKMESI